MSGGTTSTLVWLPLAQEDPVPGDVLEVRRRAFAYTGVASDAEIAAKNLTKIMYDDAMVSAAVSAIAEQMKSLASDVGKVSTRYDVTGHVLLDYATALETAQTDASSLRIDARSAFEQADTDRCTLQAL